MPKNHTDMVVFMVVVLLLGSVCAQSCANTQDLSLLLQSGNIQVTNTFPSSAVTRLKTFSIPINYAVPASGFQIASSFSSLVLSNQFANSLDFTVRGGKSSEKVAQLSLFINEDSSWVSLRLSYLISSRADLYSGSFIADGYLFQSSASNTLKFYYSVPNWTPTSITVFSATQISGIRTYLSQPLSLTLLSPEIKTDTGTLIVAVQTNTPFEMLYFTYFWWLSGAKDIVFSTFNLNDGSLLAYEFVGIDEVKGSSITLYGSGFNRVGLLSCNGNRCSGPCISVADCQTLKGIQADTSCFLCGNDQTFINNNCATTYKCGANAILVGTQCQCATGFISVGTECRPSCGLGAYVDNQGVCQCVDNKPKGTLTPSSATSTCNKIATCKSTQILAGTGCQCQTGYAFIKNDCLSVFKCLQGTVWDGVTLSCICRNSNQFFYNGICQKCSANSAWNGTNCICNTGFTVINGACVTTTCPSFSTWNGTACNCNSGYTLINGACVIITCPSFSTWNGTACNCNSGYTVVNGVCVSTTCPSFSTWNGTACNCNTGFTVINGACVSTTCPSFSTWNGASCICNTNYYLIGGVCSQCPTNSFWSGASCICISNYYLIDGSCKQCPINTSWNGTSCACLSGFYLSAGNCISCPQFSTYSSSQQRCVCDSGYFVSGTQCVKCSANQIWSGSACVCISGYYKISGVCSQCPSGFVWSGSSCICSAGLYLVRGNCLSLPPNSYYNGTDFVCNPNYYLIAGACSQCSSGSSWDGSKCTSVCPTKSQWDGSKCSCISGFFFIQNSCLPCDSNSIYSSAAMTCLCKDGYFGTFSLCTPCDSSCATCSGSGPFKCTSCRDGGLSATGQCPVTIQTKCPTGCSACTDSNTCTACNSGLTLVRQVIDNQLSLRCSQSTTGGAGSVLALTGLVVANGGFFQGVTLSTLPSYFLSNNCKDCGDIFSVIIIPNNLGITYTIEYVQYSQYWFVVTFKYAGIMPSFQYKIQINIKYANYFTSSDMAQGFINSVNTLKYPTAANATVLPPVTTISGSKNTDSPTPIIRGTKGTDSTAQNTSPKSTQNTSILLSLFK